MAAGIADDFGQHGRRCALYGGGGTRSLVRPRDSLSRWVETAAEFRIAVRSEISDWSEKNLLYRQFAEAIQSGNPPNPPDSTKLSDWIAWLDKIRKDRPVSSRTGKPEPCIWWERGPAIRDSSHEWDMISCSAAMPSPMMP